MLKTRCLPESNYKSVYYNGKTLRYCIDPKKEITELAYPEFYDIKITEKCNGNCPYCYQDSSIEDSHYMNCVQKLDKFFSSMTENQKPFQIAYGGGEPTMSPEFYDIMRITREHGIAPNYTTNGTFVKDKETFNKIMGATHLYCEGVAVTSHLHLHDTWRTAVKAYLQHEVFTNLHILISDKESIDYFKEIYATYHNKIKFFVLLPMLEHGRCKSAESEYDYLFEFIDSLPSTDDIAYGANFYPYLKEHNRTDVDLYEPEIMSKYLDLKDMKFYKSSFNLTEVKMM